MKKLIFPTALVVSGAFIATLFWNSGFDRDSSTEKVTPLPIILTKIQSLGDLHTVQYSYNNVFDFETTRNPHVWANAVPGVGSLVRSSTRNTALFSATGTVEAGIDLSQVQVAYEGVDDEMVLVIQLPQASTYRPHVTLKLHDSKPGMFWDDRRQALKATAHAEREFAKASREQGIRQAAIENAENAIRELIEPIVEVPIEFRELGRSAPQA